MARRAGFSPLKTVQRIIQKGSQDPRDDMIQKLKDQLIKVRGRQRQLAICENMLREIFQKTRLLEAQKVKSQEEGRYTLQQTIRSMNQLKKQLQLLKTQLKNYHAQLTQVEEQQSSLRRTLNSKNAQIQKLRKQSFSFMQENEKLITQTQRLNAQCDEASFQIKRIHQRIRDYENRNTEINRKISQVKSFINQLASQNQALKDKLKSYQNQNTGITDDLQKKQSKLDQLQQIYSDKHEDIKKLVENYVQHQHLNEKSMKQTKHKLNLLKMQNQKYAELNNAISKVQKRTLEEQKQIGLVKDEINQLQRVNREFIQNNDQLRKDLANCQQHLQNLLKNNSLLQIQLQSMLKQDDQAINILRRKKVMPNIQNYQSIRNSRQSYRSTNGRY